MNDRYIPIQNRQVKLSDAVAALAEKKAKIANLTDPFAVKITKESIAALESALLAEGVTETTKIVTPVAEGRAVARSHRSPYYGSYTAIVEEAGDINNLLRRNGNAAAAE